MRTYIIEYSILCSFWEMVVEADSTANALCQLYERFQGESDIRVLDVYTREEYGNRENS